MSQIRNWEEVKIEESSQNPADDLAAYIGSHVSAPGEYNLLYQHRKQESMIQMDVRSSSVTCYVADLERRAVPYLQKGIDKGIKEAFHIIPHFIDVTGEKRRQALFTALAKGGDSVPNYQDTDKRMSPEEAIKTIQEYRVAQALKIASQPAEKAAPIVVTPQEVSGLRVHGLWQKVKGAIQHTPGVQNDLGDKPKFRKK